jgi:CheY-like chemotaxis protein
MSHEIRTPMSTILGFSETLLAQKEWDPNVVKEDVNSIHDAGVTLLSLINNILDISRIESEREKLVEREYELQDLIFEINSIFSSKINNSEITFEIIVDPELPKRFYGDYQKISKIVLNILMNALKYTNYGKITLTFGRKDIGEGKFCFEIVVSNTGHAMKEEYLNFDFNDFVKIGETIDGNNIDSVTLGFVVAKRLIDMMEGKMDFLNEAGKGTNYYVYLEQKVINEEKIGDIFANKSKDVPENRVLDLSGKKVLIVDDNAINITIAKRLLEGYKVEVDSAKSGHECVEKVKTTKYDLIFLDHMMPEMDGVATLNVIKSSEYSVPPVIALTANSYSGIREKYLEEGFNDYLAKPINYKDLNKLMHRFFGEN